MNSYHKKKNKKSYTKKQNNFFKNKDIKIKYLSILFIILAIICAICLISNSQKKEETFSQIDSYNNSIDSTENSTFSTGLPVVTKADTEDTLPKNNTSNSILIKNLIFILLPHFHKFKSKYSFGLLGSFNPSLRF